MRTRREGTRKDYTVYNEDAASSGSDVTRKKSSAGSKKKKANKTPKDDEFSNHSSPSSQEGDMDEAVSEPAPGIAKTGRPPKPTTRAARQKDSASSTQHRTAAAGKYLEINARDESASYYVGPLDRFPKGPAYARQLFAAPHGFGSFLHEGEDASSWMNEWKDWTILPPKGVVDPGIWKTEAPGFPTEKSPEGRSCKRRKLQGNEVDPYRPRQVDIPVGMGPHEAQEEVKFYPGYATSLSQEGLPLKEDTSEGEPPIGWMLDAGGIVLSMDWQPQGDAVVDTQVLALAVIPHEDQELYDYPVEASKPDFEKYGTVQLWGFCGSEESQGLFPSTQPPMLRETLCTDRGRARRVEWCPDGKTLAVICGRGDVILVDVGDLHAGQYEFIEEPIATFSLGDEPIHATCLSWINTNRLAIGYADGSIALWSVEPSLMLSRHPIHHSPVVDMCSAAPFKPWIIASTPIGGTHKLTDLLAPSTETSESLSLTVNTQPNLMSFASHIPGFLMSAPNPSPFNNLVAYVPVKHFPLPRRLHITRSAPTCVSAGKTHPFMLVGSVDGCLWSACLPSVLFNPRGDEADRLCLFQHEQRPEWLFPADTTATKRGACRVLHGFAPDKVVKLLPTGEVKPSVPRKGAAAGSNKKKTKPAKGRGQKDKATSSGGALEDQDDEEEGDAQAEEDEEEAGGGGLGKGVVHEPLTRITTVKWNPNGRYGCWAAAAMASGLVRVMDLGLETL